MPIFLAPVKYGRTGNNLFQLVDAIHLTKLAPDIHLCNFGLNELGIPPDYFMQVSDRLTEVTVARSPADAERLILASVNRENSLLIYLDYLNISPDLARAEKRLVRSLFDNQLGLKARPPQTIIHVRAGDIWKSYRNIRRPIHPDYYPLPLDFYKKAKDFFVGPVEIVSETGGPDWYLSSISQILTPSNLHLNRELKVDFQDFLNCKLLVLSVSTLSWMASLVGDAEIIHYPKLGLFDSAKRGDLRFSPPKPAYVYEFEDHVWKGGSRLDKEWLMDSAVRVTNP